MKRRALLLALVLSLCLGLFQVSGRAEPRAALPEGVTEIDLRTVLGEDALDVEEAWMLNPDVCVLLRHLSTDYYDNHFEIIVLDVQSGAILSRTSVPHTADRQQYVSGRSIEQGLLGLVFTSHDLESHYWGCYPPDLFMPPYTHIQTEVLPDGTVTVNDYAYSRRTVMPGGERAVSKEDDGSLYAVDIATGEAELLIEYDEEFSYGTYYGDGFRVEQPLDDHRFVYSVGTWDACGGYGVYDLQTRTDHRITEEGDFIRVAGGAIIGDALKTDADTYETSPLPESVQEQFTEASDYYSGGHVSYDISPDGRLLALTGMKSRDDGAHAVTITDIQTGDIIKSYDIYNPFACEKTIAFCGDAHLMLFCAPEDLGSAYIYFIDIGR